MPQGHLLTNQAELDHFNALVGQMWLAGKFPRVEIVVEMEKRSHRQNSAMWKMFRMVAQKLQEAGIDARQFFKPEVQIPVTPDMLHEDAFNKIAEAMFSRTSSDLDKKEISEVGEVFIRHLAENHGIAVEWPSEGHP